MLVSSQSRVERCGERMRARRLETCARTCFLVCGGPIVFSLGTSESLDSVVTTDSKLLLEKMELQRRELDMLITLHWTESSLASLGSSQAAAPKDY